jgi:hypothetical protein
MLLIEGNGRVADLTTPRVRCREIRSADLDRLADLLTKGFYPSRRDDWVRRFQYLSEHPTPPGFPKYGYLLECNDTLVGATLAIYSSVLTNIGTGIRCNHSSWYVEPEFRPYASMLASRGHGHKDITYFNVTPDRHTLPILEARGYARYCNGHFVSFPALCTRGPTARVELVIAPVHANLNLPTAEIDLLSAHASYGCISVVSISEEETYPFVFVPRRKLGLIPYARLVYCRNLSDFVRFAKPLGQFLAKCGLSVVVLDSNGPISGLVGAYFGGRPKYFKGPTQPRLGDLAYSELAMFPRLGENTPWEMLVKKLSFSRSRRQRRSHLRAGDTTSRARDMVAN